MKARRTLLKCWRGAVQTPSSARRPPLLCSPPHSLPAHPTVEAPTIGVQNSCNLQAVRMGLHIRQRTSGKALGPPAEPPAKKESVLLGANAQPVPRLSRVRTSSGRENSICPPAKPAHQCPSDGSESPGWLFLAYKWRFASSYSMAMYSGGSKAAGRAGAPAPPPSEAAAMRHAGKERTKADSWLGRKGAC